MKLSAKKIEQFTTEGYVTPVQVFTRNEANTLRAKLEAVEATQGGALKPSQRNKSHLLFKWLDDVIRDSRVLNPIEQLIGPNILCWNTVFWIKEARSPSFVSWHQDKTYWGLSSDRVVSAWLALSPATLPSGCMRVMPGTHRGDVMPHEDRYHKDNMLTRGQEISSGVNEAASVYMPLQAGEMSIHNYRIAHASGPNTSDDRRIGVSMHFMPPETTQLIGEWDSAALVRGEDPYGNFSRTPVPMGDFNEPAVSFHQRASAAVQTILYKGAEKNTEKL